jgi:hypothetical protein
MAMDVPRCGSCSTGVQSEYPFSLGTYSLPASGLVQADEAAAERQLWFDRGMCWTFGFHRDEGIACFEKVLEIDPSCAIAHWGIAFCHGPNYNMNGDRYIALSRQETGFPSHPTAFASQRRALEALQALGSVVSTTERALIEAQQVRFVREMEVAESDGNAVLKVNPQMDALNRGFAEACREAATASPDDANLWWCLAEALMNCRPWNLWDIATGEQAPETAEIVESLAHGLGLAPTHPGLCHCAVHAYEMSPYPERCLPQCDVLRYFAPDNGHLLHMPSHIDVLIGQYTAAVTANAKAIEADMKCIANNAAMQQIIGFTCHNHHMLVCKTSPIHTVARLTGC